jgi:iron(III) transport system substrate-binding protein
MKFPKRLAAATVIVATALGVTACSGRSSGSGSSLTVYNGQHEQTTNALVTAFEKESGIHVQVRNNDENVLTNQIVTEGGASPADVIYTENSPALETLQGKHLLAAVAPATLATVLSKYNSPQGEWVGVSARVSELVYNTDLLKPDQLPHSVMDLAGPQWKGKIALAQGETDFQPIVTSVVASYGVDATTKWLTAIKSNAANNIYPNNETLTDQVNKGNATIGIINAYYWYRGGAERGAASTHSAIATFSPGDAGYIVDVSGAGILASSSHKTAAQRFLAFLVGAQGQGIIAHGDSYEYPIGSGVTTAQPLIPFGSLQPAPLTIAQLGDGSTAITLLQQAQLA